MVFDPNDLNSIDMYIKTKLDNLTRLEDVQSEERQSRMSLYYTPTERSVGSRMSLADPLAGIHINYIENKPNLDPDIFKSISLANSLSKDYLPSISTSPTIELHKKGVSPDRSYKLNGFLNDFAKSQSMALNSGDITQEALEPLMGNKHSASLPELTKNDDHVLRSNGDKSIEGEQSRNETAL